MNKIKQWVITHRGYILLALITMLISTIGLIAGIEAGLSAGIACVVITSFANIYNYLTMKDKIDVYEILSTLIGMIIPNTIYLILWL